MYWEIRPSWGDQMMSPIVQQNFGAHTIFVDSPSSWQLRYGQTSTLFYQINKPSNDTRNPSLRWRKFSDFLQQNLVTLGLHDAGWEMTSHKS